MYGTGFVLWLTGAYQNLQVSLSSKPSLKNRQSKTGKETGKYDQLRLDVTLNSQN